MRMKPAAKDVASYIADFPVGTRKLLKQLRAAIRSKAPKADEVISYGMAGYKYYGMLVYFAGYASHVGFYPGTAAIIAFKKKLAPYKTAKGTVQFPLDRPLPVDLIADMVGFRVLENEKKASLKKNRK